MSDKIRIIVADDNESFSQILCQYLDEQDDMQVVGTANDGEKAHEIVLSLKPDILILDIIMPNLDGLGVLERLNTNEEYKPHILILSAIAQEKIAREALMLGASYYIIKPFSLRALVSRIRTLCSSQESNTNGFSSINSKHFSESQQREMEITVTSLLQNIGIPANIKGYNYLREAILIALTNEDAMDNITKMLYPEIASHHNTTPIRVERAIRHAIEITWSVNCADKINAFLGTKTFNATDRATNSKLIATLTDRLKINLM